MVFFRGQIVFPRHGWCFLWPVTAVENTSLVLDGVFRVQAVLVLVLALVVVLELRTRATAGRGKHQLAAEKTTWPWKILVPGTG